MTQFQNGILTEKLLMDVALFHADNQEFEVCILFEILFPQEASVDFHHSAHFYHPWAPRSDDHGDGGEGHHSEPQINDFQVCDGKLGSHQVTP